MSYETVFVQKDGGVGIITLNRPGRLNTLTITMFDELPRAIAELAEDPSVRALVLTGSGRAFCAGADLDGDLIALSTAEIAGRGHAAKLEASIRQWLEAVRQIRAVRKAVIGAVNGDAVGGGLGLALACDIRIASDKARFGTGFARVGLVPDFGTAHFLPRIVGTAKACELIFTGDIFDAAEAHRLGIVSKVVPPEEVMEAAMALARRIAEGPPLAIALTKDMIYKESEMELSAALDYEASMQGIIMQTADHVEGVKAFLEKRKPAFKGS